MLLSYCAFLKAVKAWDQILFPDTPPWLCPLPHPRPFKECCFYSPSDSQDEKAAQCCSSSGSVAWQNPVGLPQGTASSWKWCCSVTQASFVHSLCGKTSPISHHSLGSGCLWSVRGCLWLFLTTPLWGQQSCGLSLSVSGGVRHTHSLQSSAGCPLGNLCYMSGS